MRLIGPDCDPPTLADLQLPLPPGNVRIQNIDIADTAVACDPCDADDAAMSQAAIEVGGAADVTLTNIRFVRAGGLAVHAARAPGLQVRTATAISTIFWDHFTYFSPPMPPTRRVSHSTCGQWPSDADWCLQSDGMTESRLQVTRLLMSGMGAGGVLWPLAPAQM